MAEQEIRPLFLIVAASLIIATDTDSAALANYDALKLGETVQFHELRQYNCLKHYDSWGLIDTTGKITQQRQVRLNTAELEECLEDSFQINSCAEITSILDSVRESLVSRLFFQFFIAAVVSDS